MRIDIADLITKEGSNNYRDFEAFVDPEEVLNCCKDPMSNEYVWDIIIKDYEGDKERVHEALRSIVLNLVQEMIEQSDGPVSLEEVYAVGYTAFEMLTTRYWVGVSEEEL